MCDDIDHGGRRCPASSPEARRERRAARARALAQGQVEAFIGATPFRPESGELLRMSFRPSYYCSDEWIEWEDTVLSSAERHRVEIVGQDRADGIWMGETEPAGAYLARADSFDAIRGWAGELAGRYGQDSVMAGVIDPDGAGRLYSFPLPEGRAGVVLDALRAAGVPGGRAYGGRLEIADADGSAVPPDALRVLTSLLGPGTADRARVEFVPPSGEHRAHTPIKEIQALRQSYAAAHAFPARRPLPRLTPADDIAAARAYDQAPHRPSHPAVARSYREFRHHIAAQWDLLAGAGYAFEPWAGGGQPYQDSAAMIADLRSNRHLYYFPTEASQGTDGDLPPDHPMAAPVTVTVAGRRRDLPANDVFRAVHDAIAHSEGHRFGPYGERCAWWAHRSCLPRRARLALWCETRAQNCWTNAGPHMTAAGEDGRPRILTRSDPGWLPLPARPYAAQKCVLVHPSLL